MDYAKHTDEKGHIKDVDEFIADEQREDGRVQRARAIEKAVLSTRKVDDSTLSAETMYWSRRKDVEALLSWLGLEVQQHAEYARKDGLTYADVGDLTEVRRQLIQALSFLAQRDEDDIESGLADAAAGREHNTRK
jgi:hypothetical protein